MREVLAAFDERQTLDALGLGIVRDSLADQLVPGTSTIQTRARYLLFVPWIFTELEREQVPPAELWRRVRDTEVRLIEALRTGVGPNQGVIGYRTRARTQRLPSVIYWRGLGTFRIRLAAATMEGYRQALALAYRSRQRVQRDDDGQPIGAIPRLWDPGLPPPVDGFPDAPMTFDLPVDEAAYLQERILASCDGTLLASVVADPPLADGAEFPWKVPHEHLPPPVVELLWHARCFSEVMHGAQLLYNLLLAERATDLSQPAGGARRDAGELAQEMRARLDGWARLVGAHREELAGWLADVPRFWSVVARGTVVPHGTRVFVQDWAARTVGDPATVAEDRDAREGIATREHRLKGRLARLVERRALENWNGQPLGQEQLAYRWPIVRQHALDIGRAQGRDGARA